MRMTNIWHVRRSLRKAKPNQIQSNRNQTFENEDNEANHHGDVGEEEDEKKGPMSLYRINK